MKLSEEDKAICSQVVKQYLSGKISDPIAAGMYSMLLMLTYNCNYLPWHYIIGESKRDVTPKSSC